jgi:hypothetical protein
MCFLHGDLSGICAVVEDHAKTIGSQVLPQCPRFNSRERFVRARRRSLKELDLAAQTFYHQRLYRHTFACIVRRGHPLDSGQMTTHAFSRLGHVVVTSPSRSARLLESWLKSKRIERNVALRTPHHLSLPAIIEATDLVGTVPLAVAVWFAQHGAGASSTAAVEACHICGGCFVREITADPKLIASCSHTPQFVLSCN